MIEALLLDVRLGVRHLGRDRAFAAVAIAVLGAGIGVNTMLFTILNAHTIRGLPIAHADRVVHVSLLSSSGQPAPFTREDLDRVGSATQTLSSIGGVTSAQVVVTEEGQAAERLQAAYLSASAFDVIPPVLIAGRLFNGADDRRGAPLVVLMSDRVWQSRYGGSSQVFDRPIAVDGRTARIAGVFAARSRLPLTADIWMPISASSAAPRGASPGLQVIAQLDEGRSVTDASEEVSAILTRARLPGSPVSNARVIPINQRYFGRVTDTAWLAFLAVGVLVVLISCANVANLMIDRSIRRARDVAVRSSLGASRARVIRQLLIESSLIAVLGGAVGLGVAVTGVRVFSSAIPSGVLPYWFDYSIDWRVLSSLVAVSGATVLGFGLIPAVIASRVDVVHALTARTGAERRTRDSRWTTGLMTAEIALTMIVLANVMLGFRTGDPVPPAERQIARSSIVTASISLTGERYQTSTQRMDFLRSLVERLNAMPGTSGASLAQSLPLSGAVDRRLVSAAGVSFPEVVYPSIGTVAVGPGYFRSLDLRMIAGRELSASSGAVPREAIVNERFVEMFLRGASPIGTRITLRPLSAGGPDESFEIVGAAPALRQRLRQANEPLVYLPYGLDAPASVALIVRSDVEASALVASIRVQLRALDANVPLDRAQTLARVIRDADWNGRVSTGLIEFLAALTMLLSMAGLYAVTTHAVSRRAGEIGIRLALGARPRHVLGLIWQRTGLQLLLGLGVGVAATIAWGAAFASRDAGARITDPGPLALAGALLLAVAALATLVPIRRATRIDPIAALRVE